MSINTLFQEQAVDIIAKLLDEGKILIRETVFNNFDDRTMSLYQLFIADRYQEICMLQKIEYKNGKKLFYIFFEARKRKWNKNSIKRLLDLTIQKLPEFATPPLPKPRVFFVD